MASEFAPERQIPKGVLKQLARQERLAIFYDWMTWLSGVGAGLFSGSAAIQTALSDNKVVTSVLAGLGTVAAFTQVAFKFPD